MKKTTAIVLSACSLFLLSACNKKTEAPVPVDTGIYRINDFETNAEFNLMRLFGVLGKVEKNTQSEYITTGTASAKVTVESNPYKAGAPYIEQTFELEKSGLDLRDFSDVASLSMDVYNATGAPSRVGLQLAYKSSNGTRKNFELKTGWNTVRLNVKREYIPQYTNTDNVTAPFVEGIKILFDRGQEDSVYYIDNLQLYKTEKSYTPITMSLKENEICSFDSDWQVELLEPEGRPELLASYMRVSDVTASGSGSSVRVEAPGSSSDLGSWPGIFLNREMTALVPWAEYPEDARLCFDVYAPTESAMDSVWMTMYSGGTRYFISEELAVVPGKWVTFSFSVKEMNNGLYASEKHNVATTTGIVIRWMEKTGSPRVVYFDNFRMEFSE